MITSTPSPAAVNALRGKIANPAISPRPGDTPGPGSHALLNGRGTSTRPAVPADTRARPRVVPVIAAGASVVHLQAVDPLDDLRDRRSANTLHRDPGDVLCRAKRRQWSGGATPVTRPPTCTRCLRTGRRYQVQITTPQLPRPQLTIAVPACPHPNNLPHLVVTGAALDLPGYHRQPGRSLCHARTRNGAARTGWQPRAGPVGCPQCWWFARRFSLPLPPGATPPAARCTTPSCPVRYPAGPDRPCPDHGRPAGYVPSRDPYASLRQRIEADIAEASAAGRLTTPAELPAGLAAVRAGSRSLVHAIITAPLLIPRDRSNAEIRRRPGQLACSPRWQPATTPAGGWPTCAGCDRIAARLAGQLAAEQPAKQVAP